MSKQLIPIFSEAIKVYILDDELITYGEIFSTEIPIFDGSPDYINLVSTLIQSPSHGSNQEFRSTLIQLIFTRNDEQYAHTSFERRDFHASFGNRIQALKQLLEVETISSEVTVVEKKPFTAKSEVRELLALSDTVVTIVDNYIGVGTLDCLREVSSPIRLLTGAHKSSIEDNFQKSLDDFRSEGHTITIRTHKALHDRYLLFNERCWLVGSSIKDAGKKTFNILEFTDAREMISGGVEKKWDEGTPILDVND